MRHRKRFRKAEQDDPDARCANCRAPITLDNPQTPPSRVVAASMMFPLPEDWQAKMAAGTIFKVKVVMHVDHAVQYESGESHWAARWLEVTRITE